MSRSILNYGERIHRRAEFEFHRLGFEKINQEFIWAMLSLPSEVVLNIDTSGKAYIVKLSEGNGFHVPSVYNLKTEGISSILHVHNHPPEVPGEPVYRDGHNLFSLADWLMNVDGGKFISLLSTNSEKSTASAIVMDISSPDIQTKQSAYRGEIMNNLLEDFIDTYIKSHNINLTNRPYKQRLYYIVDEFNDHLQSLTPDERKAILESIIKFAEDKGITVTRYNLVEEDGMQRYISFIKSLGEVPSLSPPPWTSRLRSLATQFWKKSRN